MILNYHVEKGEFAWTIRLTGAPRVHMAHSTLAEAIHMACSLAKANRRIVWVHDKDDGSIRDRLDYRKYTDGK